MKRRDSLGDRIALFLWRDRCGYDPATGEVTKQHNVSALTRIRGGLSGLRKFVWTDRSWLVPTILSIAAAFATTWATINYDRVKTQQQMKADAGEILLKCRQDRNGVYACRKAAP